MPAFLRPGLMFLCVLTAPLMAQDPPPAAPRQVTHSENVDPSFSPDGTHMVYISVVAGREQLVISTIDGKDAWQLTTDSANHEDPAWSPDGTRIAFVSLTATTEQIALIPATGGSIRLLTPATERAIHPNWAPDSRHLAYCTDDDLAPPKKNDAAIRVIDLQDSSVRELISGGVNTYPSWSPDGKHLAFRRMLGEKNSEVFLADSNGTHIRNLTNNPAFDGWPSWSPDGQRLAFASNRDGGDYQIYVMKMDGTDVRQVARSTGRGTAPKWTTDGRSIFFPICRREDTGFGCEIFAATAPPG